MCLAVLDGMARLYGVGFALCSYRVLGFVSLTYFGSFGWFELTCEFVRFGWLL